jgi:hypothetical protein
MARHHPLLPLPGGINDAVGAGFPALEAELAVDDRLFSETRSLRSGT